MEVENMDVLIVAIAVGVRYSGLLVELKDDDAQCEYW
jgi:hypothetical protein